LLTPNPYHLLTIVSQHAQARKALARLIWAALRSKAVIFRWGMASWPARRGGKNEQRGDENSSAM
jgi:hypothetical protein